MSREDELGRTATAVPGSASAPASPVATAVPLLDSTLGRYHLERELGAGGMGVVYKAFDPDLERRIALKVLRTAQGDDAQKRLLREARAMARLAHANVVTVHEVGSANGRDYVAMELIEGETLADWLRAATRDPDDILDAFTAAGRGLAAAHVASIVHRDFKPHNVLRARTGRIVVTDFGLAREAEPDLAQVPLAVTLPVPPQKRTTAEGIAAAATPLSGLTVAGAVLGTPAYMAPEQWSGGTVTPATDQFAFCVALWEALAGERPYRGPTIDELRAQVRQGPSALDQSKIPRRLRPILCRGLAPEPDQRWPDMDTLLARIERARRGPLRALSAGGIAAGVAGTIAFFALRPGSSEQLVPPPPACRPPKVALDAVWGKAIQDDTRAKLSQEAVDVIGAEVTAWTKLRDAECARPTPSDARLVCLDGVLARLDVLRQAYTRVPKADAEDIAAEIVASEVCTTDDPPALRLDANADNIAAYEWFARSETEPRPAADDIRAFASKPALGACARAIGQMAFTNISKDNAAKRAAMSDAITASELCDDPRVRVDALIQNAPLQYELPMIGSRGVAALQRADAAAKRVMQPDLKAFINQELSGFAMQKRRWDEALAGIQQSIDGFGARGQVRRQLGAAARRASYLLVRSNRADLEAVRAAVAKWRPIAVARKLDKIIVGFDRLDAFARLWLADPGAHEAMVTSWSKLPHKAGAAGGVKLDGVVVDEAGKPVAGATVASHATLAFDAYGPLPLGDFDGGFRMATTDGAGHFAIDDTSLAGAVVAQLGDRRSEPVAIAPHVKLALHPTRTIDGTVSIGALDSTRVMVTVELIDDPTHAFRILAPVTKDGAFHIAGAPRSKIHVGIGHRDNDLPGTQAEWIVVPAGDAPIANLKLEMSTTGRPLDVIARSTMATTFEAAQVIVLPGHHKADTLGPIMKWAEGGSMRIDFARPIIGEDLAPAVATKFRHGDLVAHFDNVPIGDITVCALGLNGDLGDPATRQKLQAHVFELAIKCEQLGPDAAVVEVAAPPQQRVD